MKKSTKSNLATLGWIAVGFVGGFVVGVIRVAGAAAQLVQQNQNQPVK